MENITIDSLDSDMNIDVIKLQKMALIYNSLENGWTVKKHPEKDVYIFTKNHGGKKEVYLDSYLRRFMEDNLSINKIISGNN
tara:strand:+ start:22852 stop:23097 length:246 start_codon:yes stop_codon:yes gene_type:complete